ncbi:MAG: hypothetical protein P4L45_14375 [Ignavibacteriaceae bacterium]|nr:hypothetical protein [Ignavibacteriaceae bacterium]
MIKHLPIILFCILFSISLFAQDGQDSISVLKNELELFNYKSVIEHADNIIRHKDRLSNATLIEIYRMKAIAQYSLPDMDGAKLSFNNIFAIDSSYSLDSSNTSPKIIAYFNQLRQNYLDILSQQKQFYKVKTDTVIIHDESSSAVFKQAVVRSVIFPGLGHFYINQDIKGITLSSLTAITLSSMIYYIIDSNKKQRDYLNARDELEIQTKYNEYNTAYKLRNISIFSLAAVWLYSQIDMLFFSGYNLPKISGALINPSNRIQVAIQFNL